MTDLYDNESTDEEKEETETPLGDLERSLLDEEYTEETEEREAIYKQPGFLKKAGITIASLILLGGAYNIGHQHGERAGVKAYQQRINAVRRAPVAKGYINMAAYTFKTMLNDEGMQETYLQNNDLGVQVKVPANTMDILVANSGNGRYVMKGTTKTIGFVKALYEKLGGETKGAEPIRKPTITITK